MNRKEAEKLADKIFDMIDRNYPRGLIKSDLVDLIAGFRWDEEPLQMPELKPADVYISHSGPPIAGGDDSWTLGPDVKIEIVDDDTWKPIGEAIEPALRDILREQRALQEIRQLFANDPCSND